MWRVVLVPVTIFAVAVVAASCQDLPEGTPCSEIPDGGCPIDRGGSCDDPTCAASYLCNDGTWVFSQKCSPHDGGTGTGGGGAGGDGGTAVCAGGDPGMCTPVNIDMTGKAAGCTPALDATQGDCPVEVAQGSCAECVCDTGCLTFFLCTQPGWVQAAYCTDDGTFVVDRVQ